MQVRPQHHQRRKKHEQSTRGNAPLLKPSQLPGEYQGQEMREQERSRQPVHRAGEHRRQYQDSCERRAAAFRQQLAMEQPEAGGDERCRQQHDTVPAEPLAGSGHEHLTEPFLGHGWPVVRVQQIVFAYDGVVLDHPVAEPLMQRGVAVPADEHDSGAGEIQTQKQNHPEQSAEGRKPPAPLRIGMG